MSKSRGQHGRAVGGARHATAPTRSAGTSSPPSSPGTATASPPRRSARACGCSSSSCGRPTTSTRSTRTRRRAAEHAGASAGEASAEERDLDRWALSRTAGTAELVAERLDAYDATSAGRAIAALVDELSNWYVRRSRRRFWDGDAAAFATLRTCLLAVAKMLAPFCPFIADEIYDNLDGELESVHLCDFPDAARSARATRSSSGDGARARDGAARARRARQGEDQGPPAAAARPWSSPTAASARRSNGWRTSCARS